ncbi:uncharacterized protein [Antedon mediterranea]
MRVWLQHNQHCPSCRIPITPDTPCKQIIGGPSPPNSNHARFSTPAIRKVRFEMIYKEYEDEIAKLNEKVKSLEEKNLTLEDRLKEYTKAASSQPVTFPANTNNYSESDKSMKPSNSETNSIEKMPSLVKLTKNLEVAAATYKQVKLDMDHLKQVNFKLRDENSQLLRDNGRLKHEIVSQSPKKYERFTAAAQHNRLLQSEKQIKQLRKALERSDNYIEELEQTLKRGSINANESCSKTEAMGDVLYSQNTSLSSSGERSLENSSFLEKPSPITPSSGISKMSITGERQAGDSPTISKMYGDGPTTSRMSGDGSTISRMTAGGSTISRMPFNRQLNFETGMAVFSDEKNNATFDNLDYTLTDELSDCAKLMEEAAHRLSTRKELSLEFLESGTSSVGKGDHASNRNKSRNVPSVGSYRSKEDFKLEEFLPGCLSGITSDGSSDLSLSTSLSNSDGTNKHHQSKKDNHVVSTTKECGFTSSVLHANKPRSTYSYDNLSDATPSTSGVSSAERRSLGESQTLQMDENGGLKRKAGEGYRYGLNSPSKTTKSE